MLYHGMQRAVPQGGNLPAPIFAYEFDEEGGTTAADSESSYVATLQNPPQMSLGGGKATSTGIGIANVASDDPTLYAPYDAPWSLELYFDLHSFANNYPYFAILKGTVAWVCFGSQTPPYNGFGIGEQNNAGRVKMRTVNALPLGLSHYIVSFDGVDYQDWDSWKIYRNGVIQAPTITGNYGAIDRQYCYAIYG
jgi:hypothetical protein